MRALAITMLLILPAAAALAEGDGAARLAEMLGVEPGDVPATFEARALRVRDGALAESAVEVPASEVVAWLADARGPAPSLPAALPPTFVGAGQDGGVHRGVSWIGFALLQEVSECMQAVPLVDAVPPQPVPANPVTDGPTLYVGLEVQLPAVPGAVGSAGMQQRLLPTPSAEWSAVPSTDAVFHLMSGGIVVICYDAGWNVISAISMGGDGTIHGQ